MAECTPLVIDSVTSQATRRGRRFIRKQTITIVFMVLIVIYGNLGLALWFTNHSGLLSTDSSLHIASPFPIQPILQGDCVQISYAIDRGSLHNTFQIQFSNFTSDNKNSNYHSAQIYATNWDSLDISYEPLNFSDSEPKLVMMNFSSCFNQTCFYDWFVYLIADTYNSSIVYNITNVNFTTEPKTTKFQVLVFNSLAQDSSPLKTVTMDTNNLILTFNGTEIVTSSYLYFAIKLDSDLVSPSSIVQFSIGASGTIPSYNTTGITPDCTIDTNKTCKVTITNSVETCVLVCLHDEYDQHLLLPEEASISNITIVIEGPFTSIIGYCILFLPYSIVFVLSNAVYACCLIYCCCKIKYIRKPRIRTRAFITSISSYDEPSDPSTLSFYRVAHDVENMDEEGCTLTAGDHEASGVNQDVSKDEGYFPDTLAESSETHSSCDEENSEQCFITTLDDSSVDSSPASTEVATNTNINVEHTQRTSSKKDCNPSIKNVTKVDFDKKGLCHYFKHCGITVVIPKEAVNGKATLELGTSVLLPGYNSEGSYLPVSPFIWVHVNKRLSSPVLIYIPHGIDTRDVKVVLLVKGHEDDAVFRVREDLTRSLRLLQFVACVEMTHFCTLCLAVDSNGNPPKHEYQVTVFERSFADHRTEVHLCILNNFMCFDKMKLKEAYQRDGFTQSVGLESIKKSPHSRYSDGHVKSTEEVEFTLSIDLNSDNWKCTQYKKSIAKITDADIDVFKFLKCDPSSVTEEDRDRLELYQSQGSYPPRFRYMFYPQLGQQIKWQPVKLTLSGTEPYEEFSFTVMLGGGGCGGMEQQIMASPSADSEVEPLIVDVLPHIEPMFIEPEKLMEFGHSLGLTVDTLTEIQFQFCHNAKLCLLHILLKWIKDNRDTYSYKHISEALMECGYPVMSVVISKTFVENDQNASSSSPAPDDYVVIEGPTVLKSSINGYKIIKEKLTKLPNGYEVLISEPSTINLNRIIFPRIGAKWKEFGTEVKIKRPSLDIIEKNRKGFCQECFNDMVQMWKNTDSSPFTWDTVVKALYSPAIKGYTTGEEIYMHLLHEHSQSMSGAVDTTK